VCSPNGFGRRPLSRLLVGAAELVQVRVLNAQLVRHQRGNAIRGRRRARQDLAIKRAGPAPIANMIEIELTGGSVLYASADGRYLIAGDLYELGDKHQEVPQMNKMGVEVRYLAYPRSGVGSPSYDKLVTAWCSSDRQDAITRMKRGEELPAKSYNPVAHEFEIGQLAGLSGTPAIVLEDGRMLDGYVTADDLGKTLGI
jgi:hypothetical protein